MIAGISVLFVVWNSPDTATPEDSRSDAEVAVLVSVTRIVPYPSGARTEGVTL